MAYTHLQIRSSYSLLKSTITIEKLVKRAAELEYSALALTDEQVLHGAISFYKACQQHGIKPIIGMTVLVGDSQTEAYEIIVLAKSNQGFHDLVKLSTWIQTQDQSFVPLEHFMPFTANCIGILSLQHGVIQEQLRAKSFADANQHVSTYRACFGENDFYLGVESYGNGGDERTFFAEVKQFQKMYHDPVVAIHDVRYLNKKDVIAYDCLQAMKQQQLWDGNHIDVKWRNHHLCTEAEMRQFFSDWSETIDETTRIAEKCNLSFDFEKRHLPSFPLPEQEEAHPYLTAKCIKLLPQKYTEVTAEIHQRLMYELSIIEQMKFSDYFLIVADFVDFAKTNNIVVGPGRGSAAGSLVAYVLGITDVDPTKYDLLFERFLNPNRKTMPDIDIDFSDVRRDEVMEYVQKKYGADHVAQIITFGTFAARSLMRELIKTMDINKQDASFVLRHIPVQSKRNLAQIVHESEELRNYIKRSVSLRQLFAVAAVLEGIPRHISTHAAGIVISEAPLKEYAPLTSGTGTMYLTQYTMNDVEAIGLLKIDLLGLRNLTLLEKVLQKIRFQTGQHISLKDIPQQDALTFSLLQQARTNGVFQLESQGMKQVLQELKPNEFEDIVAVNALYRPGPMDFIPTYIRRKHGLEKVTYLHPDLAPILQKTYGVLIYQEQIMQIAHRIAGFSLGKADILRRAVSKKQESKIEEQKSAFLKGCIQQGYSSSMANELFAWIVRFSNYGFNRSHAVAYSIISYQLAYLKAHYPQAFFAELLSASMQQHQKLALYWKEMKELDLTLLGPSINASFGKYAVEGKHIRMGLLQIKGIGNQAVTEIVRARKDRPFRNLFDFCLRVSLKVINRPIIELLIMAGAFDDLYNNRASLLASIDQAMEQGELFGEFQEQGSFFANDLKLEGKYANIEDFPQIKKLSHEKELLGIYISSHPVTAYRKLLQRAGYISLQRARKAGNGYKHQSGCVIQFIRTIRTKRGDPMAFITISDETDEMEAVVFPELYRQVHRWWKEGMLVLVQGKLENRNNRLQTLLSSVEILNETKLGDTCPGRLFIKLSSEDIEADLAKLKEIAFHFPGNTPVIVFQERLQQTYQLANDYDLHPSSRCLQRLRAYFGAEQVVLDK
ncbi:DNA polymerase III subunit alpha [Virgibacillus pantothenticus]|uniref:DNA polymerase III subunit alpha n=1 Tax=Virgibacillus TaxID=84406 RepID=UPI00090C7803|nr:MULTISPECIES: DNA polymerase III subunit alpha [Virgibacillus]API90830.1 DNA polymerase III subunit alpha [Virgibacillus sp. 6R]MBS7426735.1 DNA polymerase III subunit alpha [Virgibacillus sp. 19R1-5]GIP65456.1 DNA polymerase III subunit alpha [Virgibacillus pantothenticus]